MPLCSQTRSFKLPKIVIMQSTDSDEGLSDYPGTPSTSTSTEEVPKEGAPQGSDTFAGSTPSQLPLVCPSTVTSHPQLRGAVTLELCMRGQWRASAGRDFSLSSALCSVAQVAGAVALADLGETDEGASVEQVRANIAQVLLREACVVLCQREEQRNVRDFLEFVHSKMVEDVSWPKSPGVDSEEVDQYTCAIAESIWKHATQQALNKKELESPDKNIPNLQELLLESVNALLFNVLCITSKKINDISKYDKGSFDGREGEVHSRDNEAVITPSEKLSNRLQPTGSNQPKNSEQNSVPHCRDKLTAVMGKKEEKSIQEEEEAETRGLGCPQKGSDQQRAVHMKGTFFPIKDCLPQAQPCQRNINDLRSTSDREKTAPLDSKCSPSMRDKVPSGTENKSSLLTPQFVPSSAGVVVMRNMDEKFPSPVTCFADDLASTVVSMATELAAIYLENSSGKQPWFCGLKGIARETQQHLLLPSCAVVRRKEVQGGPAATKKHRPPRLSEIKRKAEEQPELMERLVNRVVEESVTLDEPPDSLEVTAKTAACPELSVVDTSKPGQPRTRLQCERWNRGKAASCESIPEEDAGTLGPGARLGQNLSRGSSVSKQSSCESITDEFSRFMVNQMESEGRGFELLLDYYAGKNASAILSSAVQQVASRKNGHLNVRSSCVSKQSSTESITEEFYRFMLRDLDSRHHSLSKTKERRNSLLPPALRSPFCIRQSSMPDRRSSDSRLTVNSTTKANSFDGFVHSVHGDTLSIHPASSVSAMGLCKSDSCLYQRGQMDRITDTLIHETWSSSIESLMRKNKIIADSEDSEDLEGQGEPQPHVELFANRLAANIVESGKSLLGSQQTASVCEKRRCFRTKTESGFAHQTDWSSWSQAGESGLLWGPRDVPEIHIQEDQKDQLKEDTISHHPEDTLEALLQTSAGSIGSDVWGLSNSANDGQENIIEGTSNLPAGGSTIQRELLVMNFDMDGDCMDWDLRATLQWIAASELGVPTLYLRKSQERADKFLNVVQLVTQKGWRVGDLFGAVMRYCQIREERASSEPSLLDWLLQRLCP
ncbi:hypothetical protein MATL_G00241780 [Megalops atlanticus]|uniref:A-kinase anchor 110kDa C-terminal domain-containing protein n=1 Tax=Megalops atlanticus TaxID=7932 RepID=A0A9D3PCF1_MEGAT|nr:hypothetical protein MATL_G00241780 [Megalops atlanticus]